MVVAIFFSFVLIHSMMTIFIEINKYQYSIDKVVVMYSLTGFFCWFFFHKNTGSEIDDEEMIVSESENSNDSWTTEEFSSEFIMRYGSRLIQTKKVVFFFTQF